MDTGETHHLTSDLENLTINSDYHGSNNVKLTNGNNFCISRIGSSNFVTPHASSFKLHNILYVPDACANLLLVSFFAQANHASVEFFSDYPHESFASYMQE